MISMYLLGNPDHYTGHTFIPFYWRMFVNEAQRPWQICENGTDGAIEKVTLIRVRNSIIGLSPVYDYIYSDSNNCPNVLYFLIVHSVASHSDQTEPKCWCM
jgi:hypothetical protein